MLYYMRVYWILLYVRATVDLLTFQETFNVLGNVGRASGRASKLCFVVDKR